MRRSRLAAAGAAAVIALSGVVAAADDHTGSQAVTIEVTVEPRELTVNDATITLADVTYGFDYSDDANPGVVASGPSRFLVAGSSGFTVKSGPDPDGAQATAELVRLQDVTDPEAPTNVLWSDVFAANPDAEGTEPAGLDFSLRLSTVASCTPDGDVGDGCRGISVLRNVPAINALTTASVVTAPVPMKSASGAFVGLVGTTSSDPPFPPGVTGNVTVNFLYLGRPMLPDAGGSSRTIEIDIRYVLADAT